MPNGMWFVISIPRKEYELKLNSVSSSTSKESLSIKKSEGLTVPNGAPKAPTPVPSPAPIRTPEPQAAVTPALAPATSVKESQSQATSQTSINKHQDTYFVDKRGPLEDMMKDLLTLLGITDAVWCSERNDKFYQVFFPCESGEKCDHILKMLAGRGIGFVSESTVAVLPCAVFYQESILTEEEDEDEFSESDGETTEEMNTSQSVKSKGGEGKDKSKSMKGFKSMQQQFLKSVTARLTVAQVVEGVRGGATLTFDFIMFVALASLIAAFGLMESSSVTIVAAMLVSPIMGPIMAGTFGAAIRDRSLIMLGVKSELFGLSFCLTLGLIIGFICGNFADTWGSQPFPTSEMAARGQSRSLWVGVLIALPSGAGVALSILGGNAGCLVGVAISASLLPPTVNAGMLWGLSVIKHISSYTYPEAIKPHAGYEAWYFPDRMDKECAVLGIVSFFLTVVNICCIIISAMLILKIKEVAPVASVNATKRFWKQDIKIARDYNKTINHQEASEMGQQFLSEWANLNGINAEDVLHDEATQYQTLQDMINDVEDDDVYRSILTYVPTTQTLSRRLTMGPYTNRISLNRRVSDIESGPAGYTTSPIQKAINKRRHTRLMENMAQVDEENTSQTSNTNKAFEDPDLAGVRLRRSAPSLRSVNPMLRKSLASAASPPYSLWPSRNKLRRLASNSSRFVVTPVDDIVPPLPPRFSRKSKQFTVAPNMESNI